ncbi:unnamed protein product, partial [Anisakis simplex]|uniref:Titin n=1 Tax=Anisakis simplex TaxID=6269 RepID=A0A0M3J384_ANISI
ADSQPQISAQREPQKPAIQTSVEPPESVVTGESVTGKVVEEYRYDSGKPDERVSGEQPAEGGGDFMKPAASSVYATIPSVLAQQPAAASTTTVETTVKLQPHIPSREHAPVQAESVQTQEFISQETMGNLEPKKLIEETVRPKDDQYAEEPNKVKDLEGLAKKEAEELQKLFEEYQIIAEKPAEPASYSKPMPVAEYAQLHQTPQQQIKTIPPEHPPFPSASFEQESPLKDSTYQPGQVPVPQQQPEELPSQPIQSTNLATEHDQPGQHRVRSDRPGRILGIRVEKPEYEEAKVKRFVETVQTPEEFEYSRSHPVRVGEHLGAKVSETDQQRSKDEALERQRDQQETAAATAAIELASDEMKRLAEVDIYVQDAMDYVSAQRQEQDEMYRAQYPLPEGQQAAQAGSRMDTISGFVIEEEMLESVGRSGGHQLPLSGLQKQAQQLQKKPEDGRVSEREREDVHEHEPEHGRDRDREKAREVDREHDREQERGHLKATFSNEQISGEATSELVHTNEEFEKIEHIAELDDTMTYAPEIQSIEIPPDRSSENSENLQEYFDQVAAECMVGVFKQPQKPGRFPTEAPSAIPTQKLTDMTPSISSAKSYTSSEGERVSILLIY